MKIVRATLSTMPLFSQQHVNMKKFRVNLGIKAPDYHLLTPSAKINHLANYAEYPISVLGLRRGRFDLNHFADTDNLDGFLLF